MLNFISLLKQRYHCVLNANDQIGVNAAYLPILEQLMLAEAFYKKGQSLKTLPLQIAVIGPTQAGKSSIVNMLLQENHAGVSPLAGYTVHPQGFCHQIPLATCVDLSSYFQPFVQCDPSQLNRENYEYFTLTPAPTASTLLPPAILWDTPDFDSIDSDSYREGVLKTIALADILILVVSKEKYADQTVWEMMQRIEPLRQPTLVCINKLNEGSEQVILASIKEKWGAYRHDIFPEVLTLFYQKTTQKPIIESNQQNIVFALAKNYQREKHHRREQKLLQLYWQTWTKPVKDEHFIYQEWQCLVDTIIQQAIDNYEQDYLNHPHHYETFQQAIAELLLLLEIPAMAHVMMTARRFLLYPLRQLRKLQKKRTHLTQTSHEMAVLSQLIEHTLTNILHQLMGKNRHRLWREISQQLHQERTSLQLDFNDAAADYHQSFQQAVELAAQSLYCKLQEQPLVLNTLRATRVTADAAVIAMTLYTGGIGLHDLVIAPAMLAITNFLTESVIGSYMHRVASDLKQQQRVTVIAYIFQPLKQRLYNLPHTMEHEGCFNISPKQLEHIEATFNEKPHGLRLF